MTDDSALSPACHAAGDGRLRHGAKLKFFHGPMDCGKSTLALQIDHNHARQGRRGLVLTRNDRSGDSQITTRIGLGRVAIEVTDEVDLRDLVRKRWVDGIRVDYLICDEAQFYSVDQVEQMADLVDCSDVDVYAFGLATDFRSCLFPAAKRLLELADEVLRLQVEVLCWCGREGHLNARVVDGAVAREGAQVVIGDTAGAETDDDGSDSPVVELPDTAAELIEAAPVTAPPEVRYQVLCRRHYRSGDLGPAASTAGQMRLV